VNGDDVNCSLYIDTNVVQDDDDKEDGGDGDGDAKEQGT
jgi:hypothetical protein